MKIKILIAALSAAFALHAQDDQNAVINAFVDPRADGIIYGTHQNERLDMADYHKAGLDTPTVLVNDMHARITSVNPAGTSMTWQIDQGLDYELDVITRGKKTYLLLIETMSVPERDSRLRWFAADWHELKEPVDMPVLDDWLTPEGLKNRTYITAWLPYITATVKKSDSANELIFTHTLHQKFIAADDLKRLEAWLKPSVTVRL